MNVDKRDLLITASVLFLISILSFISLDILKSPPISSDDWSLIVAPYTFNELRPYNLLNHRPFDMSFYYILTRLFGVQFEYFYITNLLVLFLSAALIYVLTKKIFPQQNWFASAVSIVYLVYPVDFTRTWIIMLYIRFWWLVSLASVWFVIDYAITGKWWKYFVAMAGIILPLGAYEGQFGFVAAATTLTAFFLPGVPKKRRFILLGSLTSLGFLFYIWRFQIQARIPDIKYYSAGSFQFNPSVILERYWQGFTLFFREWPSLIERSLGIARTQMVIGFFIYSGVVYLLLRLFDKSTSQFTHLQSEQIKPILKVNASALAIGGILWIAGYFPIIGLYSPSLNTNASRVNLFAIAGAALLVVSFVTILAIFITKTSRQHHMLTITLLLPLIMAGVFTQRITNKEKQIAWNVQKDIWTATFDIIPNLQDDKQLVIVIPGYAHLHPFQTFPFTASWEINAATQVLYNNQDIGGLFLYKDVPEWQTEFKKNGIIPSGSDRLISYKKLIFVLYDPKQNTARIIDKLEEMLELPIVPANYVPYENIVPLEQSVTEYRWLTQ